MAARSLCILLADEHAGTLSLMARLLRHHGHPVHPARTAEEAKGLAATARCDLFVGDVGLPDSAGFQLMRELREQYGLKGIAISGHVTAENLSAAVEAGYARYFTKPI